jgi:hypothetical protein
LSQKDVHGMGTHAFSNRNDLCLNACVLNDQPSHGDRKFEAAGTGAAGIEIEDDAACFLPGYVAMTGDDDFESGGFRVQVELRQIVQHVDGNAGKLNDCGLRQAASPVVFINVAAIDVAADGGYWGDGRECFENFRRPNVTSMNDVFRPAQRFEGFGPKQSVRIRDDADENWALSSDADRSASSFQRTGRC